MNHEPWAIRLLAFVGHLFLFVSRGIFAAIATDPQAALAFSIAGLVLLLSLPLALRALITAERWIARHVRHDALDREYAALCATYSLDEPGPGPAAPPPVQSGLKRRRMGVRTLRRRVRHTTTSDRSSRL